MWLRLGKKFFNEDKDIYLAFVYITPDVEQSAVQSRQQLDSFELLETDCHKYQSLGKVVLLGDFNSRVAEDPLLVHRA